MTWLAWRQFRANAVFAVLATVTVVALLVTTRGHVAHVAGNGGLTGVFKNMQLFGTVLVGVPAFIGAFWGAPLVARELETGAYRLAWTQSVTRRRWLGTKLAVTGLAAVIVTAVFSLVFTWWSAPLDALGNRVGTANFGQRGIVPIAYALFALALGTLVGILLRRTLPAMATTLAAFFVARFSFQWLVRPHLLAVTTVQLPNNMFGQRETSAGGWILSTRTVDAHGHVLTAAQADNLVAHSCSVTRDTTATELGRCADRIGLHDLVRMHPASQFWALQTLEALCFVAAAMLCGLACFWWVRHRLG